MEHRTVGLLTMLWWQISKRGGKELLQVLHVWEIFSWLLLFLLLIWLPEFWCTDALLHVFQWEIQLLFCKLLYFLSSG
jgi:hypothetical protein